MSKQIKINDKVYPITIIYKPIKHLYLRVKDGSIEITTNRLNSVLMVDKFIKENESKIIKLISHYEQKKAKEDKFYYLGQEYKLVINDSLKQVSIENNIFYAKNNAMLNKYLKTKIINLFNERLEICYNMFTENIPYPGLKLRSMTSRWGVCHIRHKTITLNTKLINYEIKVIDYVIVHELSHLIHPHHQKEFWDLVSKYIPDYKIIRKKLKE